MASAASVPDLSTSPDRAAPGSDASATTGGAGGPRAHMGHIEVIRGIACLMVVAYHIVGNDSLHGLRITSDSLLGTLPRVLDAIQMPIFAFLAGRVFVLPTASPAAARAGWLKKATRLAMPLVSVTVLLWTAQIVAGKGEGKSLITALVLPFEHLWFLQASLILVSVAALGSYAFRGRPHAFAAAAAAGSLAVFLTVPRFSINVFALEQAIYLAPYFFFGLMMRMASTPESGPVETRWPPMVGVALVVAMVGAAGWTWQVILDTPDAPSPYQNAPAFLFAMTLTLGLMWAAPRNRFLEALGARSYTIYLFHVFVTSPTRQVLRSLWPTVPPTGILLVSLVVGVGVPWVMHELIVRNRVASFLLLGQPLGRAAKEADGR